MNPVNTDIENLYRQYSQSVFRICLSYTRTPEDARDLVHDVFIKVQRALPGFREKCSPFTWIYRIAIHACLNHLRNRRFDSLCEIFNENEHSPDFSNREQSFENRRRIGRVLGKFDKKTQMVALLIYGEGQTQEEVAQTLKISRRSLNNRLERLRKTALAAKETV